MSTHYIRTEIIHLDSLTGMHAQQEVKITFDDSAEYLGRYIISAAGKAFVFSKRFDLPKIVLLNVIRHEYAHYMAHSVYHCMDHSFLFRRCCEQIGCDDSVIRDFLTEHNFG